MPTTKIFKNHNATIAVTANAEVMFTQGGQVHGWTRRLANAVERGAEAEAPVNKRPRWGHYGKPLKGTISSQVGKPRGGRHAGLRVYASVGSSAPHAKYVDQGTGVFAGGSPWKAKVLPPYAEGSPSLYEHTWHPPGQTARHTVMIKGQRPQFFFSKGLHRGFQKMRLRSYQVPTDPRMSAILRTWPRELENFSGNTAADGAFIASLTEWRLWRDEAFDKGRLMGEGETAERTRRRERAQTLQQRRRENSAAARFARAQASARRSQKRRDRIKAEKAKSIQKPKQKKPAGQLTRSQDKQRVKALAVKKFGASNVVSVEWDNGRWEVVVKTFTIREADGRMRPDFKVYHIKARSL